MPLLSSCAYHTKSTSYTSVKQITNTHTHTHSVQTTSIAPAPCMRGRSLCTGSFAIATESMPFPFLHSILHHLHNSSHGTRYTGIQPYMRPLQTQEHRRIKVLTHEYSHQNMTHKEVCVQQLPCDTVESDSKTIVLGTDNHARCAVLE